MAQQHRFSGLPLIGGIAAAIAASACCLGPLVLVMLGVSGAWIGNLAVLEPYRPYSLGIAVVFLIFAWRSIYRAPAAAACAPDSLCAMPQTNRIYRVLFWIVAALIGIAFVFPYLAPLFY